MGNTVGNRIEQNCLNHSLSFGFASYKQPDDKQHTNNNREIITSSQEWEDIIALEISDLAYSHLVSIRIEQETKEEEETMDVKGRCLLTGLPKVVTVSSTEMMDAFEEPVERIMEAIHSVLERTPPELVADISTNGIVMTGGGSLLYGLDQMIATELDIPVLLAKEPMQCAADGLGNVIENYELLESRGY